MKRRTYKQAVLAMAAVGMLLSCNSGNAVSTDKDSLDTPLQDTEKWGDVVSDVIENPAPFECLDLSGLADVVFQQDDTMRVEIEANEKVMERYTYKVENGTLVVKIKDEYRKLKTVNNQPAIRVHVAAPTLKSITIKGASEIKMADEVRLNNDLTMQVSGASEVYADDLRCHNLRFNISGAGKFYLKQVGCTQADLHISGACALDIEDLKSSGNVDMKVSGAGDIDMGVACHNLTVAMSGASSTKVEADCDYINAVVSGVGRIKLSGHTKRLDKRVSGIGSIRTKNLKVGVSD